MGSRQERVRGSVGVRTDETVTAGLADAIYGVAQGRPQLNHLAAAAAAAAVHRYQRG